MKSQRPLFAHLGHSVILVNCFAAMLTEARNELTVRVSAKVLTIQQAEAGSIRELFSTESGWQRVRRTHRQTRTPRHLRFNAIRHLW